jgi:hypothetical protein
MTNVGQNMQSAYTSDVEEILTFKTSKGFKMQDLILDRRLDGHQNQSGCHRDE